MSTAATIEATCTCGKTAKTRPNKKGEPKIPMRWRAINGELRCPDCVQSSYYTRGFRVRIVGLAEHEERDIKEFRAALSAAAKASARFGNWYVQRLLAADLACDTHREKTKDGKDKMPPCPEVDYYRPAVLAFPELSGASISALARMVRGWYAARRFDALVRLNRSVENYRFGYLPIEVRKQDWKLTRDDEGKFSIRLPVQPGKSWPLRVYADGINLGRLKAVFDGSAVAMGAKIVRAGVHRAKDSTAPPRKAWFLRVSAMFPRTVKKARQSHQEIALTLGHDAGCLLFGSLEGSEEVFEFPGVALKQTIVGGDKQDRLMQQENSQQRGLWSRRKRERWGRHRTLLSERREQKVKKQIELAARSLSRWCAAHGVTSVDYDTQDRGYLPHMPWRALRDRIACTLEEEGIALHVLERDETDQEESEAIARA